jgi:hypothetical protein
MTTDTEQLATDIKRVMDLDAKAKQASDRLRVAAKEACGTEEYGKLFAHHYAFNGAKQAFLASASLMADIIRRLTDIVRFQHEAGNALAGMTKSDGMTRNEAMALWDAAFALSAPLVKEEV